jgi:hypothetical protein
MPVDITSHSRWRDTRDQRLNDPDWRRVFDVDAIDGDTVRGSGYWEVRSRTVGDERADTEGPWETVPGGMVTHDQFSASEFTDRFVPLRT